MLPPVEMHYILTDKFLDEAFTPVTPDPRYQLVAVCGVLFVLCSHISAPGQPKSYPV